MPQDETPQTIQEWLTELGVAGEGVRILPVELKHVGPKVNVTLNSKQFGQFSRMHNILQDIVHNVTKDVKPAKRQGELLTLTQHYFRDLLDNGNMQEDFLYGMMMAEKIGASAGLTLTTMLVQHCMSPEDPEDTVSVETILMIAAVVISCIATATLTTVATTISSEVGEILQRQADEVLAQMREDALRNLKTEGEA